MSEVNLGPRLKEIAHNKGISVETLAQRLNKSEQAIYDMFKKKDLNTSLLKELSKILNVEISYFFEGSSYLSHTENVKVTGNSNTTLSKSGRASVTAPQDGEIILLKAENQALKREVELLKKMVDLLEKR